MVEAATILRAAGHHAAPIPLAETMLARWLGAACGLRPPAGPLTIAPVEPDDRILLVSDTLTGRAGFVPWGGDAAATLLIAEGRVYVAPKGEAGFELDRNLAGEPDLIEKIAEMEPAAPCRLDIDLIPGKPGMNVDLRTEQPIYGPVKPILAQVEPQRRGVKVRVRGKGVYDPAA